MTNHGAIGVNDFASLFIITLEKEARRGSLDTIVRLAGG